MSDLITLGASDSQPRWIGVRRHQVVLIIVGLVAVGDAIIASRPSVVQALGGVLLLASAVPVGDDATVALWISIAARYATRSRWSLVRVEGAPSGLRVTGRSTVRVNGYRLRHRGRLDLSGRDEVLAERLAVFVDGLASSELEHHVSIHTVNGVGRVDTLLTIGDGVGAPDGWTRDDHLIRSASGVDADGRVWLLERWGYVRTSDGVTRVLRVRDFTSASRGRPVLEVIQDTPDYCCVAVHVGVVGSTRAHRIAQRAVHRVTSDDTASSSAGFRRTARHERSMRRLAQHEALVAQGAALLRLSVFAVVRSDDLDGLGRCVSDVTRRMGEAGLRCDGGSGRQAPWYRFALPGGPG